MKACSIVGSSAGRWPQRNPPRRGGSRLEALSDCRVLWCGSQRLGEGSLTTCWRCLIGRARPPLRGVEFGSFGSIVRQSVGMGNFVAVLHEIVYI